MRSCIWITSAVGSSDSTFSRATEAPATALSLSSAPTTAYPVIFFSILTAMTRFLVCLCCGAWCGWVRAKSGALTPTPLPHCGRGALSWLLFLCGLAGGLPGRGFLRGLARGGFPCRLARGCLLGGLARRGLLRRLLRAGLLRRRLLHGLARGGFLRGLLRRLLACGLLRRLLAGGLLAGALLLQSGGFGLGRGAGRGERLLRLGHALGHGLLRLAGGLADCLLRLLRGLLRRLP